MNSTPAASPPSPVADDVDDRDLVGLLSAYQYLQSQNLRMSSHLAQTLQLNPTDLRVLIYLLREDSVSPKDLATRLEHTTGSITALVDRLEKTGHLERRPHPTDRRSQTLHLTEKGADTVDQVKEVYGSAFDGVFTGPTLRAAASTLTALGDALKRHLPPTS